MSCRRFTFSFILSTALVVVHTAFSPLARSRRTNYWKNRIRNDNNNHLIDILSFRSNNNRIAFGYRVASISDKAASTGEKLSLDNYDPSAIQKLDNNNLTSQNNNVAPYSGNRSDNNENHQNNQSNTSRSILDYQYEVGEMSIKSFNMDLQNLASDDPSRAEDAVHIMRELYNQKNITSTILPDTSCYTTVIDGYIQAGMLQQAQDVFDQMEELAKNDPRVGTIDPETGKNVSVSIFAPSDLTYTMMAQGWANDAKNDFTGKSAEKAEYILRRMENAVRTGRIAPSNRYNTTGIESAVTTTSIVKVWSIVVDGWCKRAGIARQALHRAETLLNEMENTNQTLVRPNVLTYTSYIGGLSRSKMGNLATRAEQVLDRMEAHGVQPDTVAYTSVINCWARAVSRRERQMAASRALKILSEMERMYIKNELYIVKPSLITYSAVIGAIGNSLDTSAPELAQDVLKRMEKLHQSGVIANLKPVTSTYNAVIYALSRAPAGNRLRYARRAEQILEEMSQRVQNGDKTVQPDVRTWAAVLRAWSQSRQPDSAENAQRVLDKMEDRYKKGLSPVRPNFVCYTTVMGAWSYSKSEGALDKMEGLLQMMENKYEETLEADVRPNTVSYVTCIDAFVRRNEPDAAHRAQAIVDRMIHLYAKGLGHVRPTRSVFNVLIHAWSRSKENDAAQKAEQIFKWMEAQYQAGDELLRPDEVSLCAVLNAWANHAESGGAERAQQVWEHIDSVSSEERGFRPTIAMPNIVIKAIARSKDPNAVSKAEKILIRLEEDYKSGKSYLRPDVTTYSSVINAAAYCVGDTTEALSIALRTFNKLSVLEDEFANNITYGTLFKAINNLMVVSDERDELIRKLFDQCCEEGNVDSFVLTQVRYASPKLYSELVEGPCGLGGPGSRYGIDVILKNIPTEWSANVVE